MQAYYLRTLNLNSNRFLGTTGLEHPEVQSFILRELFSSNLHKQTLSFNLSTPGQFFKVTFRSSDRGLHSGTWAVYPTPVGSV